MAHGQQLDGALGGLDAGDPAAPRTSPLWIAFDAIAAVVSGSIVTRQRAIARRDETSEGPTSRANGAPIGSRWS